MLEAMRDAERGRALRLRREPDAVDLALAAIWAALNANGFAGWQDWYDAAARGEW
jgi:hypothetical protein